MAQVSILLKDIKEVFSTFIHVHEHLHFILGSVYTYDIKFNNLDLILGYG